MAQTNCSRRTFLKQTAALGAAAAFPTIVPSTVFGQAAPSNKIVMGAIGTGSMGIGDLNGFLHKDEVRVVAVCDVDKRHRENAKNTVDNRYGNKDCVAYHDFRDLINRGDLDAVMTALPDHWHAITSVMAAKAGLDIHGQKPLARSIREGRAICDAVHRYARVWQTGSWQRSVAHFRRACELVRNGRIGKVSYVEVGLPTGGTRGPQPEIPVPDYLDWNFWLGPAPWRPYCDFGGNSPHWNWRWIMDYSGGQLTDWAGHNIDIAHWGLDLDHTGPVEIEGKGEFPANGLYDVPVTYRFRCKYATGLEMVVANNQQVAQGAKWFGEKGWIHVHRGGLSASDDKILKEVIGPDEIQLYNSRDHLQNFLDCVKSRKLTITPVETAQRSISVGLLGEIAMITGRKIRWNPETEEIINDPAASALLGRAYRQPWTL
jgi:predicted dehydrogenase